MWQTAVDLVPPYRANNVLPIHYGSPVISARNTVLVPVKLNLDSGFRVEARAGANGALLWSAPTDYVLPAHDWTPSYNIALTQGNRVYFPGAGGKLYFRDNVDSATGSVQTVVFYGSDAYDAAPAAYDAAVLINTPLTIDPRGNVYFGFMVIGTTPIGLQSGIARVAPDGTASWVSVRGGVQQCAARQGGDEQRTRVVGGSFDALRRRDERASRRRAPVGHAARARRANARHPRRRSSCVIPRPAHARGSATTAARRRR